MGISVIICCYNSALNLPQTIKHLANQIVPQGLPWEIIVVNNNSTDDTKKVAEYELRKYESSYTFKISDEPQSGTSYARKRGLLDATYEYLIFCDDDNWLCNTYVADAHRFMLADPELSAIGGQGDPVFETPEPAWFKYVYRSYALGPQNNKGGLYGAGLVAKKKTFENLYQIGFESLLSDRSGTTVTSGGDLEYVYLVQILGYKIEYKKELKFQHYIQTQKLTMEYLNKLYKGFGAAGPILECYGNVLKQTNLSPTKQWSHIFFDNLFKLPLIFLFGKSKPKKTILLMNLEFVKSSWLLRNSYSFHYSAILNLRDKYRSKFLSDSIPSDH